MTAVAAGRRALVISFSDLHSDPRAYRQLALLNRHFEVTAAGHADPRLPGVRFVAVPAAHWSAPRKLVAALMLKAGAFERAYWSSRAVRGAWAALKDRPYELIVANDIWTLPLALALGNGAKVLFDAHEYSPLEFEDSWRWRFFFQRYNEYLCRRYLPLADAATTVCEGLALEYLRTCGAAMTVVENRPPYAELEPSCAAPDGKVRLVHHGAAIASRRIESMIEVMDLLDERFHLDLMLVPAGDVAYLDRLRQLAATRPRVRFVPPVPMQDLPRHLNGYDAGLFLLPPANFNYRHALPNKFFEFIQGRLAVAIGPSPEMARLTAKYDCGIVAEDFSPRALAAQLNALDPARLAHFKRQSHAAARELCFENNIPILLGIIDGLLGSGRCAA